MTDVNESPTVTGDASIDHAENGIALAADPAEYTASDPEEDDLKWSLSGADASKFNISETGAMRTLAFKANPDYESPGDSGGNNVYEVTVKVTDSKGNTAERAVTVKVTNIEEDGTVELSTLQPRIGFAITATLTDADNITAGSVTWQWYKGTVTPERLDILDLAECVAATTNECFIKGATSATYTPVLIDIGDTVVAVALYTDGSPNEGDDAEEFDFAMMVTANTVLADTRNKAPVFPDQDGEMEGRQTAQERSVPENTASAMPIGTGEDAPVAAMDFIIAPTDGAMTEEKLTYTLGGPDADSFSIDRATAQLSTKAVLDYETKDTYIVMVTATDPSGETATVMVTIKVTGVDEAPIIMVGGLAISGRSSVSYTENRTDAVATYMVTGPDAALASWSLEGPDAGAFTISSDGVLTFNDSPDYEMAEDADTDNTYMVTVKADDGTYMDTHEVAIRVTNEDEAPPVIIDLSISGLTESEYLENSTDAVEAYVLTGTNAGSATWSLEGADEGDFTIIDGVLRFSNSPDYEMPADADTDNVYMVTVKASDGTDMATNVVTVTVTNVDEVPSIAGDATIEYAENDTRDVATYMVAGPNAASVTWDLEGADAGDFDISNGGVLRFSNSPDYETPADDDTDNVYMVTVKASDGTDMAIPRGDRHGHQRQRSAVDCGRCHNRLCRERHGRRGDLYGGRPQCGFGHLGPRGRRRR